MSTEIRVEHSPTRMSVPMGYPYTIEERVSYSPSRYVRDVSRSPVREMVTTSAPPMVEKVFEKSVVIGAVATADQQEHCHRLRSEAEQMRLHMNEYNKLVDELRALQATFNLQTEENMLMRSEYASRGDASAGLVASLKQELEDQMGLLDKTRKQNDSLHEELDMQEDYLHNRNVEISKSRAELDAAAIAKQQLVGQSQSQADQINSLKDSNARSVREIAEQNHLNDQRSAECNDLTHQVNSLDMHQQCLMKKNDDLNNILQHKTADVQDHEAKLSQCELEINTLNGQILSFQNQLKHLKTMEDKYVNENSNLQNQNMDEGSRNCQLSANIHDLSVKIQAAESRVMSMKGELGACKEQSLCFNDNNSNLQGQISSLNSHIRVVTGQNAALTTELNSFVEANEALRMQLDRKARVIEVRQRNEEQIARSSHAVNVSRSPIRELQGRVRMEPLGLVETVHRVPVYEEKVVETRVPMMERVERTIEAVPGGHRLVDSRSRSPLLHTTSYPMGGYVHEMSRVSAATPTVNHSTTDDKEKQ